MADPFSLTHRNGRKFRSETGSVASVAFMVDDERTSLHKGCNALPGLASPQETEFVNESLGVSRPMARHRQIRLEINGLATGTHLGTDGNRVSH